MSAKCFVCNDYLSTSYKFKKKNKNTIIKNKKNVEDQSSPYCHRICPECLIRHIFITDMPSFGIPSKEYCFDCPCKNGSIQLSYEQLIDVFQNKTFDNLQKKKEKKCKTHKKVYSKYCRDCHVDICEDCIKTSIEEHLNHRIENKKILLQKLKKFFGFLNLKNNTFELFMKNFDEICKKYKGILENNYNSILINIDKSIKNLIDFRAKYSAYYNQIIINSVQTLKLLKMFYCNYYYDIKKAEKSNDFKIYQYLNQIKCELDDVIIKDNKASLDKIEEIKNNINYLNDNINDILNINFQFKNLLNEFRKYQAVRECDDKVIKYILKIDEHKLFTVGEGYYIQCLEETDGDFSKTSRITTNGNITSILLLKNGNILTSFGKTSRYNIQEWIYKNIKSNSINDFEIINEENKGNSNIQYLYEKESSFLSTHNDDINAMIEMNDSMFATGGNDKKIIIWKKDEDNKNYKIFQKLTTNSLNGITQMIFLYDKRFVSSDSYSLSIWKFQKNKNTNSENDYSYSLQQKITNINGIITALYQIREGSIVSGNNNSNFEVWSEVDGKYKSIQSTNLKIYGITCINQLKDDKIIVASNQGLIKILTIKGNDFIINEFITTIKGMSIQCIECLEDGSFVVGQKSTLHVWKNNESI